MGRSICLLVVAAVLGFVAPAASAANYQGLWYASPAESKSGRGPDVAHQGDVIFATWFTYDANGKAWWLSIVAGQVRQEAFDTPTLARLADAIEL